MRIWLKAVCLVAPLALAGCTTTEDLRARDQQTCREYGFKKRNDAFAACLQRLDLDRRADRREDLARLQDLDRSLWGPGWPGPRYYRPYRRYH